MILPASFYNAIAAHARADAPHEACGLLRGRGTRVTDILPARNVASNPSRDYQVDPHSLLQALSWEDDGDEIVAIYHSHPSASAYPSAVDAANAFYPDSVYLILSLQQPQTPELRGFYLRPEAVFHGKSAKKLLRDVPFRQVRPGLWGFHLAPDETLPGLSLPRAADIAFYLVFDENARPQPSPLRLIAILPAPLTIQI